ncbi:WbuC family cupin fold metalloprotein [Cytophagaceae bacterium ABcell3]|nr:WbuC family cupin fold metalloprotein [Cytophagaceae bacterium ABcell3]
MIKIDSALLDETSTKAAASPRRRMNYNFHSTMEDSMHRMLNAMEPGTYVQPHKHEDPDKTEAFIILRGSIAVVIFDADGTPQEVHVLKAESGSYGLEIPPRVWHTLICLEPGSVIYEIKHGPYTASTDKNFASWAPAEEFPEAHSYLQKLINQFNLKVYGKEQPA